MARMPDESPLREGQFAFDPSAELVSKCGLNWLLKEGETVQWIGTSGSLAYAWCYAPRQFVFLFGLLPVLMVTLAYYSTPAAHLVMAEAVIAIPFLFIGAIAAWLLIRLGRIGEPLYALTNRRLIISYKRTQYLLGIPETGVRRDGRTWYIYDLGVLVGAQVRIMPNGTGNIDFSSTISVSGSAHGEMTGLVQKREPSKTRSATSVPPQRKLPAFKSTLFPGPVAGSARQRRTIIGVTEAGRVGKRLDDLLRNSLACSDRLPDGA